MKTDQSFQVVITWHPCGLRTYDGWIVIKGLVKKRKYRHACTCVFFPAPVEENKSQRSSVLLWKVECAIFHAFLRTWKNIQSGWRWWPRVRLSWDVHPNSRSWILKIFTQKLWDATEPLMDEANSCVDFFAGYRGFQGPGGSHALPGPPETGERVYQRTPFTKLHLMSHSMCAQIFRLKLPKSALTFAPPVRKISLKCTKSSLLDFGSGRTFLEVRIYVIVLKEKKNA